jgi:prephenate dehydrogenase
VAAGREPPARTEGAPRAARRLSDLSDPDLTRLREQIAALDRELLDALNRRLELVRRVQSHKQATGAPAIDAKREAELLKELAAANAGPLSERALRSIFSAVLDVMKQETRGERAAAATAAAPAKAAVERLAVVGTGLVGTSVALAAKRSGVARVTGWDGEAGSLHEAAGARALTAAGSLPEAVEDAQLVVVAVPVGSLVTATLDALSAASPQAVVTDVGSTKRGLAAAIDDARFVPGHPLAGGTTGGPARAAADLFDGATWFLTPLPSTDAAAAQLVERFVASLGAHPARLAPDEHDRLLAFTSHLPHALANLLMRAVAGAGENALGYAGASLREMTRVAGANAAVWADIFVENGDLIADALAAHGAELEHVERALRDGDRAYFEQWIAEADEARNRMLEYAYRTEARMLNRVRVRIPDTPGVLARITQTLGAAGINIEDFELRHVSPEYGGVLVILISGAENAELARTLLRREGYSAA